MLKFRNISMFFVLITLNQITLSSDPRPKNIYPDNLDDICDTEDDLSDDEKVMASRGIQSIDVSKIFESAESIEERLARLRELMHRQITIVANDVLPGSDSPALPAVPQNTPTAQAGDKK